MSLLQALSCIACAAVLMTKLRETQLVETPRLYWHSGLEGLEVGGHSTSLNAILRQTFGLRATAKKRKNSLAPASVRKRGANCGPLRGPYSRSFHFSHFEVSFLTVCIGFRMLFGAVCFQKTWVSSSEGKHCWKTNFRSREVSQTSYSETT